MMDATESLPDDHNDAASTASSNTVIGGKTYMCFK